MNNFYRYPLYRSNNIPPPPPTPHPPPILPPKPPPAKKKTPPKKKFDLKCLKKNACTSLNDVEHFLCNFSTFIKYIKLYNLLK